MLWEHKTQATVSTAFLSSPKLCECFHDLVETQKMCSISFRKHCAGKSRKFFFVYLFIKM